MRLKDPFSKKSLGQNFLVDHEVINKILLEFQPTKADVVLEIGPGRGALTEQLIERSGKVYALEFDRDLAPVLREKFGMHENFSLLEGDALKVDFRKIAGAGEKLRLIANLPYNISTAILQRLFSCAEIFTDCVLMFQREVVERIMARPGTSERGYLTVLIEAHFSAERLFDVPPTAFRPAPRVWSSVVRLIPTNRPVPNEELFRQVLSTAFAQKRKTILNNLKHRYPNSEPALMRSGVATKRRAETLHLDEWLRLTENIGSGS
ncbi:MAG: 16S rRNA (adenine(1518)-N(6)/adenine(1519)-N(6))-dimethyltransferase RsmA [Pyrinomonadaceae bacterium]